MPEPVRSERNRVVTIEELVKGLAIELGHVIPEKCAQGRLDSINERDQLQPWSAEALRGLVAAKAPDISADTSVEIIHKDEWPRLGPVDLALRPVGSVPAYLELKCGSSADSLGPCAWDVLKLAFLLRAGECAAGYVVAATTTEQWTRPLRGAEFFVERADWSAAGIRDHYADWFRTWSKDGYSPPLEVPAGGQTNLVTGVEFEVGGTCWEVRIGRVQTNRHGVFVWEPLPI